MGASRHVGAEGLELETMMLDIVMPGDYWGMEVQ